MKAEKIIKNYILNVSGFTWVTDIAEHTIWGFKGAPYKTFERAIAKVKSVVSAMLAEGLIEMELCEGCQTRIYKA